MVGERAMRLHSAALGLWLVLASSQGLAAQSLVVFSADFDEASDLSLFSPYPAAGTPISSDMAWDPIEGQPPGSLETSVETDPALFGVSFYAAGACFQIGEEEPWSLRGVVRRASGLETTCLAGFQQFHDSDECSGSVVSHDVAIHGSAGFTPFEYDRPPFPGIQSMRPIVGLSVLPGATGTCFFDSIVLRGPGAAIPMLSGLALPLLALLLAISGGALLLRSAG